jgi:hypothetical protein
MENIMDIAFIVIIQMQTNWREFLLVIETPDWNKDKFGANITEGIQYSGERRTNALEITPIPGETLAGYNRRILAIIQKYETINLDAHSGRAGKKMWFTHRTPSSCWICNEINIMWMLSDVLDTVASSIGGENFTFKDNAGKLILHPH